MKKTICLVWLLIILVIVGYSQGYKVPIQTGIETGENIAITETKYGKVRGYIHDSTYIYKGIPYGKAKRFMPAQEPDSWEEIRSSTMWGPTCPMMDPPRLGSDEVDFIFQHDWGIPGEDCLRLNVWTPGINDNMKRPVMIWIHGGGYSYGSSQELPMYDGENLCKTGNVVYVSVNHRLNLLGFADLSDFGDKYNSSVNVGMIDLVDALEWVRDNISNFGGDPNNVTIFGQSGGGGKVSALMSTPSAKGLFHKAVVQSGMYPNFKDQKITKSIGREFVKNLGLTISDIDSIQNIPYSHLIIAYKNASDSVKEQLAKEGVSTNWLNFGPGPTQDGEFLPFTFEDPNNLAISEDVPLMIGTTKNEFIASLWGGIPMKNASLSEVNNYIENKYGDKSAAYIKAVKKAYPKDVQPTDLIDVDLTFRPSTVKQAKIKSSNSSAPVYAYLFTWQSPVFDGIYKAIHCMELPFVFNNISLCKEMTGGGKEAYVLADKVSNAWINFARFGDPNHEGLPKWKPYTDKNGVTMFFNNECQIRYNHDSELLKLNDKELLKLTNDTK